MATIRGDRYWTSRPNPNLPSYEVVTSVSVDDLLSGTVENDVIYGGYGRNIIHGGAGNDLIYAEGGSSIPSLPWADDVRAFLISQAAIGYGELYGEAGEDTLRGGPRADILDGGGDADWIYGGGGDDIVHGSSGADDVDGGAGFDTIEAIAHGQQITLYRVSVERITNAGFTGVTISGSAYSDILDFTAIELQGIVSINGGAGEDRITGSLGGDVILAGSGDVIDGGAGNDSLRVEATARNATLSGGTGGDSFDFSAFGTALTSGYYYVDGAKWAIADDSTDDRLILPGSVADYEFRDRPDGTVTWHAAPAGAIPDQYAQLGTLRGIDRLVFESPADNVVKFNGEPVGHAGVGSHVLIEQMQLIIESYGSQKGYHEAEGAEFFGNMTKAAAARGWHRLSALELGMATTASISGFSYALSLGEYRAVGRLGSASDDDPSQAVASVLLGNVDGKRTLALTFRGTDQRADWGDYADFTSHYSKFAPLIHAIETYVDDDLNGIEQVLVSGHSLGGAMVQEFMATHQNPIFRGFTIGSPGSDNPDRFNADTRIFNIGNTADPVFAMGTTSLDAILRAVALGAVASAGDWPELPSLLLELAGAQLKNLQGVNLFLHDSAGFMEPLAEHDHGQYFENMLTVLAYAFDQASPFHATSMAQKFRAGEAYEGDNLRLAIVNAESPWLAVVPADRFILGSPANDRILAVGAFGQSFDGGAGDDWLVAMTGPLLNPIWHHTANGDELWDGNRFVLEKSRFEKVIVVPAMGGPLTPPVLFDFGGREPRIQQLAPGATSIQASADYDLVDTRGAARAYSSNDDDIFLVNGGPQSIHLSVEGPDEPYDYVPGVGFRAEDGRDIVAVGQSGIEAGARVTVYNPGDGDIIANTTGSAGELVIDLWDRLRWGIDRRDDGLVTLHSLGSSGSVGRTLVSGDVDFAFDRWDDDFAPGDMAFLLGNASANLLIAERSSHVVGGAGGDILIGSEEADLLDGGSGANTLKGGAGDDIYVTDFYSSGAQQDVVVEGAGGGTDHVYSGALSTRLAANVEKLTLLAGSPAPIAAFGNDLDNVIETVDAVDGFSFSPLSQEIHGGGGRDQIRTGDGDDALYGDGGSDLLHGEEGNDRLDGGDGADIAEGGEGNDHYFVDQAGDRIAEYGDEGADRVFAAVSYALGAAMSVETLTTTNNTGTAAINLTGNELANTLVGNAGTNLLDGKNGADVLSGLAGNDWFHVDSAADRVLESIGEGSDRVVASASYVLAAGVSVEVLTTMANAGTAALNLTGNALTQAIVGNAGANRLDSGGGGDTMSGLGGDDFYYVRAAGDRAVEAAGGGSDRVFAAVSFALEAGSSVEMLTTADNGGTAAINLTGNELANVVFGNAGANILDGRGGADTLAGLGGSDFYYVDNAGDRIVEGAHEGTGDRVFASVSYALGAGVQVEILGTTSNAGTAAINLTGNEFANILYGNAGANIIDGKAGADTLVGFGGADQFRFASALGGGNVDRLVDFLSGTDRILLDDAAFAGLGPGALPAGAFVAGTRAQDANDRIVYDGATGRLYYDADGNLGGAALLFATLDGRPALAAGDFIVI